MDFDLFTGMAVLERTPGTLRSMLDGLSDSWLDGNEGDGTWSPREVVAHLVHAERTTWLPRANLIVGQGTERRFPPFDRSAHLQQASDRPIADLLGDFASARAESLVTLRGWNLSDAQFSLTGEHPEFGTVTLRELLSTWVAHDLGHMAQITRVMAKQYRDAVGPWRAYLSIMDR